MRGYKTATFSLDRIEGTMNNPHSIIRLIPNSIYDSYKPMIFTYVIVLRSRQMHGEA